MLAISNGYFSLHFLPTCFEVPTRESGIDFGNDPAAGSPTATLLRLLLPLAEKYCWDSRRLKRSTPERHPPPSSIPQPIGSNDGRCVQMAGT